MVLREMGFGGGESVLKGGGQGDGIGRREIGTLGCHT
jgi:hypothetical protein